MKLYEPRKPLEPLSQHRNWILVLAIVVTQSLRAQPMPADHAAHADHNAATTASLPEQIETLKVKVAQLDEALRRAGATTMPTTAPTAGASAMPGMAQTPGTTPPMPASGMAGMSGGGEMGGMMQMMGSMMQNMGGMMKMKEMGAKPAGAMAGDEMPGMSMGGGMKPMLPKPAMQNMPSGTTGMHDMMGMPPMAMGSSAALPGFPGASHLYHIGADEFFLNHDQHISLTTAQRTSLSQNKEKALLDKASADRNIAQAEQDLWQLTSSDQPDAAKIEAKIRDVEKLRGDERMNFIRTVGEAAKLLTPEQIKQLLGQLPPAMQTPATPSMPGMKPGADMGKM